MHNTFLSYYDLIDKSLVTNVMLNTGKCLLKMAKMVLGQFIVLARKYMHV